MFRFRPLPVLFALLLLSPAALAKPPNFVVIMAEAQGWSSLSAPIDDQTPASKSEFNRTPNLDDLATKGMRFSRAYAASPRCTPSRAALLTGMNPARLHMTFVNEGRRPGGGAEASHRVIEPLAVLELPALEVTIADLLKKEGYATAHFGKWHLGRVDPRSHGFDESDGATANEGLTNNPQETDRMTDRAVAFMARQAAAGKPFYLQVSHYPARGASDVPAAMMEAVRARLAGKLRGRADQADRRAVDVAAAQSMDDSIGRLTRKLDELGLTRDTWVVYTADHGSQGRQTNAPLSSGKGTIWEGGLRVRLIIAGPGVSPGTFSHTPVTGQDIFPTIADLARVKSLLPKGIEGGSLAPILRHAGKADVKRPHAQLFFHFPHYDMDESGPASAVIFEGWKFVRFYASRSTRLYDLNADPAEQHDLSAEQPARAKELDAVLAAYLAEAGADLPTDNPNFNPNAAPQLLRPGARN